MNYNERDETKERGIKMSQYRCVICGSEIEPLPGSNVAVCPTCETRQEIEGYIPTPQQQQNPQLIDVEPIHTTSETESETTDEPKRKKGFIGGIATGMITMLCIIALGAGVLSFFNNSKKTEKSESGYINAEDNQTQIGDYIEFGSYEQDGDRSTGSESIEWLVLDKEDDKILVISKYALDCKPYNEEDKNITWEKCTLRAWLNDDFLNGAFTEDEIRQIPIVTVSIGENPYYSTDPGNVTHDKIFLLSINEAKTYFKSDKERECKSTEYAVDNGAWVDEENGNCWWWLRSPGLYQSNGTIAFTDGAIGEYGDRAYVSIYAVRPAMWINIK